MRSETHLSADGSATEPGLGVPQLMPATVGRVFLNEQVRVGRYELIYRLGSGGMATVFVGRLSGPAGFERMVAIKVIHQHLADSKKFVNMFLDEARMAALIHHPNVVEIHEVGRDQGLFYMVGEFVHGPDLGKLLRRIEDRNTALSPAFAAHIAAQVCLGLQAAHETRGKDGNLLNLIHRDVSPNNVLISYDGYIKLIDFGVAWAKNKLAHTESGALKGKIGYISPEQILGQEVDHRSDIFSVGVLLYIMATLTHPFPGKSDAERLNKIISGEITPPRKVRPDVHPGLEEIILKAMASSPDERYTTASVMAKELEAFISSLGETVKTEDMASFLAPLFEVEKQTHQSSVAAYRAARDSSSNESELDDTLDPFADDMDEPSRHTPLSYSKRRRLSTRPVLYSMLSLAAAAIIGVLIFMFFGRTPVEAAGGDEKAAAPTPTRAVTPPGIAASPPKEAVEGASGEDGVAPAATMQTPTVPLENEAEKTDAVPTDEKSTPIENSGPKRKKTKSKKSGADLLNSPYS